MNGERVVMLFGNDRFVRRLHMVLEAGDIKHSVEDKYMVDIKINTSRGRTIERWIKQDAVVE